ncbi:hypothetical protein [Sphingosinicella microcystinivorans]|uniref:Uncharacterized protein n=1 Tax=Sphingosinicella microcystinivorans TaxID=335406 RepID=A0AAD1D718_SPHMI|nr:hypothetical protein [Sphingosinicella microcystinivorans]RKS91598.1 hypothetical protein DFR51_1164 [Sphingosinicella microcystinivorans]BBE34578.1 hypothetical protein SmB9_22360 [Sphingosinicella microcystinivorans]
MFVESVQYYGAGLAYEAAHAVMVPRGAGEEWTRTEDVSQSLRITVGAVLLVPVVAAFLLTGFPAKAAPKDQNGRLADPSVHTRIDASVKQSCRDERLGSVEHSICLAEARKDAWRNVAEARGEDRKQSTLSLR